MEHKGTILLETERLRLRKFKLIDAEDMYNNWASDDSVTEYLKWPTHNSIEVTKEILLGWMKAYEQLDTYSWAIELKENNSVIGSIGVGSYKAKDKQCTIGYCLGKKYWNKGITTEALRRVIKYLIDDVDFERVQAYYHSDNPASGRVMMKAGMIYEGRLRHYVVNADGRFVDCDFYGFIKGDIAK